MKRPEGFERRSAPRQDADPAAARAASPRSEKRVRVLRPRRGEPARSAAPGQPVATTADGARPERSEPRTPGTSSVVSPHRAARRRRRFERRERRRFTRRSRHRRTVWLTIAIAIVGVVVFAGLAAFSPVLSVRTVRVECASRVDRPAVRTAVADQLGRPMALVDFARIRHELAGFGLIRSYSTRLVLPGTLVIDVTERTPLAAVHDAKGYRVVDQAGVTISTSTSAPKGYPLVTARPGGAGFRAATAVLVSLPKAVRSKVASIGATTRDDVSFALSGGPKVVWGGNAQSTMKARVLARMLTATAKKKVAVIDVSSPENPITR